MKPIVEPTRWLDPSSGIADDLRTLLREGREALGPTPEQLERLGEVVGAVGAAVGTGVGVGAGTRGLAHALAHAIGKSAALKLAIGLTVGAAAATTVYVGIGERTRTRGEVPPSASELQPSVVPTATAANPVRVDASGPSATGASSAPVDSSPLSAVPSALAPSTDPAREVTREPAHVNGPAASPALSSPASRSMATAASAAAPESSPPPSEIELLAKARGLVQRDPNAALAALRDEAALYPRGTFEQEREVVAIEALVRLGRKPEASQRAADFFRQFPQSVHARRIRVLLGEETP